MKIREGCVCDGIVMAGVWERDNPFFAGVSIDDELLKSPRDDFIVFGQEENGGSVARARVRDAVQLRWNFLSHGPGEEPEVPPPELPQDNLTQRRRIVQDQSSNFAMRGNMKRGRCPKACAENDDRMIARCFLQFVECRQRCRS